MTEQEAEREAQAIERLYEHFCEAAEQIAFNCIMRQRMRANGGVMLYTAFTPHERERYREITGRLCDVRDDLGIDRVVTFVERVA